MGVMNRPEKRTEGVAPASYKKAGGRNSETQAVG